jgi:predicted house-cleaning NTP pyrophosphatase (Maf/HAM1 superfamily)
MNARKAYLARKPPSVARRCQMKTAQAEEDKHVNRAHARIHGYSRLDEKLDKEAALAELSRQRAMDPATWCLPGGEEEEGGEGEGEGEGDSGAGSGVARIMQGETMSAALTRVLAAEKKNHQLGLGVRVLAVNPTFGAPQGASSLPSVAAADTLPLVLGTASTARRAVIRAAGVAVAALMKADIDEKAVRHEDPYLLPLAVARAKAMALLDAVTVRYPAGALLLTCDQVVLGPDGSPREKPETAEEAAEFVRSYAGSAARTISAICVTDTRTGKRVSAVHVAAVHFAASLAAGDNVQAVLTPCKPVSLTTLVPLVVRAAASSTPSEEGFVYGSDEAHGRNSSAPGSDELGGELSIVSIFDCAGGLCIEHAAVAPHILRIESEGVPVRGGVAASEGVAAGRGGIWAAQSGLDSIMGLPWLFTRELINAIA